MAQIVNVVVDKDYSVTVSHIPPLEQSPEAEKPVDFYATDPGFQVMISEVFMCYCDDTFQ